MIRNGTFRRYLRDVHGFRGGRFGLDAEQASEVFPEDQIELIGIAARVFDDLGSEPQCRLVRSLRKRLASRLSHPIVVDDLARTCSVTGLAVSLPCSMTPSNSILP